MAKTLPLIRAVVCILYAKGDIMCIPPYNHVVSCSANLRRWPYDSHTCAMMIGSWTHTGEQINISLSKPGVRKQLKEVCMKDRKHGHFCLHI
jgi:hypothetical protein